MSAPQVDPVSNAKHLAPTLVDDGAEARERTAALLRAMGVTRVIWVDDQHALDDDSADLDQVREGLFLPDVLVGIWRCLDLAAIEIPASLDQSSPEQTGEYLDSTWADMHPDVRRQIAQVVRTAQGASKDPALDDAQRVDELESIAIEDLLKQDGVSFLRLSMKEWREQSSSLIDTGESTLLLVDRDFHNEGGGPTDGEQVLASVLKGPAADSFTAALFTRTVEDEDAERETALKLARDHEIDPTRVTAIGKFRSRSSLPEALRVLLLAAEIEGFRDLLIEGLEAGHSAAKSKLESLHRYTLLGAVAAASEEGSYELDMPTRIVWNELRPTMEGLLRKAEGAGPLLERFRDTNTRKTYLLAGTQNPQIKTVLWADLFESAERINELHLPVEVGDIFETYPVGPSADGRKPRVWILLSQACDLSIRRNGRRTNSADSLSLTQLRPSPSARVKERSLAAQKMHPVGPYDRSTDDMWEINAALRISVPAIALDATVFGPGGRAVLPSPEPTAAVSEGWNTRRLEMNSLAKKWADNFRRTSAVIQEPPAAQSRKPYEEALTLIGNSIASAGTNLKSSVMVAFSPETDVLEYGIRRAGRVTAHKATYLLNLAMGYYGRPADEAGLVIERPRDE